MALLHLDAQANYIQSIPENTGGEGGYTEMVAQADTTGGFAGGVAKISGPWALLVEPGHLLQWWVSGRPVYAGVVVDPGEPSKTEREVTMLGALRNCWENTPADLTYASATQLASAVIKDLITNYTADPLISTDVSHVQTSGYTIAGNLAFSKQHLIDMATRVNNFEGWEWGGFLPNPGSALLQKTAVYYRPPDTSTLHYSVAANELKESPKFSRDWSKFGNKIRVYYGAASHADYNGTATSDRKSVV